MEVADMPTTEKIQVDVQAVPGDDELSTAVRTFLAAYDYLTRAQAMKETACEIALAVMKQRGIDTVRVDGRLVSFVAQERREFPVEVLKAVIPANVWDLVVEEKVTAALFDEAVKTGIMPKAAIDAVKKNPVEFLRVVDSK